MENTREYNEDERVWVHEFWIRHTAIHRAINLSLSLSSFDSVWFAYSFLVHPRRQFMHELFSNIFRVNIWWAARRYAAVNFPQYTFNMSTHRKSTAIFILFVRYYSIYVCLYFTHTHTPFYSSLLCAMLRVQKRERVTQKQGVFYPIRNRNWNKNKNTNTHIVHGDNMAYRSSEWNKKKIQLNLKKTFK